MKMFRQSFCSIYQQYIIVAFTYIAFKFDFSGIGETFALDYIVVSILVYKVRGQAPVVLCIEKMSGGGLISGVMGGQDICLGSEVK